LKICENKCYILNFYLYKREIVWSVPHLHSPPPFPLSLISFKTPWIYFYTKVVYVISPPLPSPSGSPIFSSASWEEHLWRAPIACIICLFKGMAQRSAVYCSLYLYCIYGNDKKTSSQIFFKTKFFWISYTKITWFWWGWGHRSHNLSFIQIKI